MGLGNLNFLVSSLRSFPKPDSKQLGHPLFSEVTPKHQVEWAAEQTTPSLGLAETEPQEEPQDSCKGAKFGGFGAGVWEEDKENK